MIDAILDEIRQGRLIAFPTETVWSLSCSADNPAAADALRGAKGRPDGMPLAVGFAHWPDTVAAVRWTPGAQALAEAFLPGPLSIILEATSYLHLAQSGTLSVRVPDHPLATEILEATGPLVMTSANPHGAPDPISRDDVASGLPGVAIFGDGPVSGRASTIVDATGKKPRVLREGVITKAEVEEAWR